MPHLVSISAATLPTPPIPCTEKIILRFTVDPALSPKWVKLNKEHKNFSKSVGIA